MTHGHRRMRVSRHFSFSLILLLALGASGVHAGPNIHAGPNTQAGPSARAAGGQAGRGRGLERPAAAFDADVALDWSRLLYERSRAERLAPMIAARIIGYTEVALYEAVVPGMPDHRSLGGQLNELGPLPAAERGKLHWPAVANRAVAETLRGLLPTAGAETQEAIDELEGRLQRTYALATNPAILSQSLQRGSDVAAAILLWASSDGFAQVRSCPYTPPAGDGLWVPTPPAYAPALQPCWGLIRTMALPSASTCAPPAPPAYSTDPASDFYAEAVEVRDTVDSLTSEQQETALFWSDDPGLTGTPAGHSLMIAAYAIEENDLRLDGAAEALARVGIALHDSFVACWKTKYIFNLLRPVTYIQTVLGEPDWLPLLTTPPFPEYTSGHSVQSAATAEVLTDLLGAVPLADYTHVSRGFPPRLYESFRAAAEEAAISRVYGGIHYRSAIENGLDQGACIGRTVLQRVQFR